MCYLIPLTSTVATFLYWRKKRDTRTWYLFLMFFGGALFGVIDHLWNGELFLISENVVKDLILGVVITAAIFAFWKGLLFFAKKELGLKEIKIT